ncbi:MAG: aspartyl/asparaginyl beta-hydroxylase domain-containing protein [Dokdonella sp.]
MRSIPGQPLLDKNSLIGGCIRLPIRCDVERLAAEVRTMPDALWGSRGGRVGVHTPAQAVFLRGYAPADGDLPVEDRDALAHLPYAQALIRTHIPAPPMRCLLALLPGGATILPHIDQAPYFGQTIRIHVPIATNPQTWMYASGLSYRMAPGEIWALNNSAIHGVWNGDHEQARMHLICDFLPSPALLALLAAADRDLGIDEQTVRARLFSGTAAVA